MWDRIKGVKANVTRIESRLDAMPAASRDRLSRVKAVLVAKGAQVAPGKLLMEFEPGGTA